MINFGQYDLSHGALKHLSIPVSLAKFLLVISKPTNARTDIARLCKRGMLMKHISVSREDLLVRGQPVTSSKKMRRMTRGEARCCN